MQFTFTPSQEASRQEVRQWLAKVLPRFRVGRDFAGTSDLEVEDTRYSSGFSRELGSKGGIVPTREASISKIVGSEVEQKQCRLLLDMLGHYGTLARDSKHASLRGKVLWKYLDSVANAIRAGTSEIQRNIIATRGLGLPR